MLQSQTQHSVLLELNLSLKCTCLKLWLNSALVVSKKRFENKVNIPALAGHDLIFLKAETEVKLK